MEELSSWRLYTFNARNYSSSKSSIVFSHNVLFSQIVNRPLRLYVRCSFNVILLLSRCIVVRAHCYCASLVRTLYMTWRVPRYNNNNNSKAFVSAFKILNAHYINIAAVCGFAISAKIYQTRPIYAVLNARNI